MSTIKDVAKLAGVSVPTAYKVFSATYFTSAEVQKKVFAAAKELGYVHKSRNKNDEQSCNKVIAIFLDEIGNPFYEAMLKTVYKEMERLGYMPMVMYYYNDSAVEEKIFELAISCKCAGIIFIPGKNENSRMLSQLKAKGFPLVQLFRAHHSGVDTLLIDDELGTYQAIQYLIQSGHERIMLVETVPDFVYSAVKELDGTAHNPRRSMRGSGYIHAYREAGLPMDDSWIYRTNYLACEKEMIKERIRDIRPTAILAAGEGVSIDVLQTLNEMHLSIPEDISFILYDNIPWASINEITTVSHSYEKMGELVVKMIQKQVERQEGLQKEPVSKLMLNPILEVRKSVKILR